MRGSNNPQAYSYQFNFTGSTLDSVLATLTTIRPRKELDADERGIPTALTTLLSPASKMNAVDGSDHYDTSSDGQSSACIWQSFKNI